MRGDHLALDQFSLTINQGESLAILGANGAGKSTLLKLINGDIYPLVRANTEVEILGEQAVNLHHYRRHIGLISQDLQDAYQHSVPGLEVVLSGFFASISLWQHHEIQPSQLQRARAVMAQLDILNLADCLFGRLSTGQQRRLLLARALVHKPDTLILDEPTSGLDIKACFQYMHMLSKQQSALVLVTHHIHEIPAQIDRVVLIKNGKNLYDGSKKAGLTKERLSDIFDTNLDVIVKNGVYQVYPASD